MMPRLDTSLEQLLERHARSASPAALATIVATAGSTYRKAGARMLVESDGRLVGLLSDPNMNIYIGATNFAGLFEPGGNATLLRWQAETALWVIVFSAVGTYVLLKLVGLVIPLRASDADLEIGDHAIHGHEVYPADVASLGTFGSAPLQPAPASPGAPA